MGALLENTNVQAARHGAGVRGQLYDAPALLESVKGKMGPATSADDGWWQGNTRFGSGRGGDR